MKRTLVTMTREGFTAPIILDEEGGTEIVTFTADADIDADGSPRAYHPRDIGTDFLANAKDEHGNLVGVLTRSGRPVIQGPDDLAPGYYVSATAYEWPDQPAGTQRRYVDGERVSFAVVPPIVVSATKGAVKGCSVRMTNIRNGGVSLGIVADVGPRTKCGEVSPQAARELGLNPSPKYGGTDDPIIRYEIFPGVPGEAFGKKLALMRSNGSYLAA